MAGIFLPFLGLPLEDVYGPLVAEFDGRLPSTLNRFQKFVNVVLSSWHKLTQLVVGVLEVVVDVVAVLVGLYNLDKMFAACLNKLIAIKNLTGLLPFSLFTTFTNYRRSFGRKTFVLFSCLVTSPQRMVPVGIIQFGKALNVREHKIDEAGNFQNRTFVAASKMPCITRVMFNTKLLNYKIWCRIKFAVCDSIDFVTKFCRGQEIRNLLRK